MSRAGLTQRFVALLALLLPLQLHAIKSPTVTLEGQLIVVDVDYDTGAAARRNLQDDSQGPSRQQARAAAHDSRRQQRHQHDTHFVLQADDRSVWPLVFAAGSEPPEYYGSALRVALSVVADETALLALRRQRQKRRQRREQRRKQSPRSQQQQQEQQARRRVLEDSQWTLADGAGVEEGAGIGAGAPLQLSRLLAWCKSLVASLAPLLGDRGSGSSDTGSARRFGPAAATADGPGQGAGKVLQRPAGKRLDTAGSSRSGHYGSTRGLVGCALGRLSLLRGRLELPAGVEDQQPAVGRGGTGPEHGRRLQQGTTTSSTTVSSTAGQRQLTVVSWAKVLGTAGSGTEDPEVTGEAGGGLGARDGELDAADDGGSGFRYNTDRLLMDDVSTIIFVTDMCGHGPAASREELERVLFETGDGTENVEAYMGACSSGQGLFSRNNVRVVGPISLDCTGETFGVPWRTDACSADDYFGWQYAVEQWCDDNGVDYRPYRHRVVLTSPGKGDWMTGGTEDCSWSGLGVVGALSYGRIYAKDVFSYAWVSGDHWSHPQSWLHELGHNYYLKHASTPDCPYCDDTCAMGFCCTSRCFNAPHMWQVGWEVPMANLSTEQLPVGRNRAFRLRPQGSATRGSFLRVNAAWAGVDQNGDADTALWVSYRQARPPHDTLVPDFSLDGIFPHNHIHVYSYKGSSPTFADFTYRLAMLSPGESYRNDAAGLAVTWAEKASSINATDARVRLCRFTAVRESGNECFDLIDNDCDGLTDMEDPDCMYPPDFPAPPTAPSWPSPPAHPAPPDSPAASPPPSLPLPPGSPPPLQPLPPPPTLPWPPSPSPPPPPQPQLPAAPRQSPKQPLASSLPPSPSAPQGTPATPPPLMPWPSPAAPPPNTSLSPLPATMPSPPPPITPSIPTSLLPAPVLAQEPPPPSSGPTSSPPPQPPVSSPPPPPPTPPTPAPGRMQSLKAPLFSPPPAPHTPPPFAFSPFYPIFGPDLVQPPPNPATDASPSQPPLYFEPPSTLLDPQWPPPPSPAPPESPSSAIAENVPRKPG